MGEEASDHSPVLASYCRVTASLHEKIESDKRSMLESAEKNKSRLGTLFYTPV